MRRMTLCANPSCPSQNGEVTYQQGNHAHWVPALFAQSVDQYLGTAKLAVPKSMKAADRLGAIRDLMDLRPDPMTVVEHQIGDPFDSPYPWVLFLDSQGVLRAASNCRDVGFHTTVARWAKIYRGR